MPVVVEREPREEPDAETVERVARALCAADGWAWPYSQIAYETRARAAIGAMEGEGAIRAVVWEDESGVRVGARVVPNGISLYGRLVTPAEFREFCEAGIALADQQIASGERDTQ